MPDKMFLKKNAVCDIIDVYVNTEVKACFKRNRLYIAVSYTHLRAHET